MESPREPQFARSPEKKDLQNRQGNRKIADQRARRLQSQAKAHLNQDQGDKPNLPRLQHQNLKAPIATGSHPGSRQKKSGRLSAEQSKKRPPPGRTRAEAKAQSLPLKLMIPKQWMSFLKI